QPDLAAGRAVPLRDVPHVIIAVERGDVDVGIVPIENSIEGSITVTLDTLAFDTDLLEQREIDLPISLNLCARPGTKLSDITTIVCFQREDRPGSLLAILQEFAASAINLSKLESRPAKRSLGEYCFFIDFVGHLDDELVADRLRNLHAKQAEVKFLDSYPVAG